MTRASSRRAFDPQLDAVTDHLLNEIKTNGYHPPKRPASPDRRGMGIRPSSGDRERAGAESWVVFPTGGSTRRRFFV